ncbi:MAG: hypothetical protein OXI22_21020 [Defluviicoccus sp.]|nr:hypothetical protein [Defluviicoccus sp.]MDE0386376.1 hypothetical protein [Defluviicoccus sp.]
MSGSKRCSVEASRTVAEGERLGMRKHDLDELLARVTPDNLHPEQDTGEARGNEEW